MCTFYTYYFGGGSKLRILGGCWTVQVRKHGSTLSRRRLTQGALEVVESLELSIWWRGFLGRDQGGSS